MKYAVLIGDGMADMPIGELGGKTPLEYAATPHMDRLCAGGVTGLARTVPRGVPPGSDTAILSIFGCDPRTYYSGRSPLEAAGCGVRLEPGQVSFRANLTAIAGGPDFNDKTMMSHSGGNIEGEEALALMNGLMADRGFSKMMNDMGVTFALTPSFRHIAVMKADNARGLTPPHDILGQPIGGYLSDGDPGIRAIVKLMRLSHAVLDAHPINAARAARGLLPANCLWFWGPGGAVELPDFAKTQGKTAAVVTAVPLVKGIGALCGVPSMDVDGATGDIDTNYEGKVSAALLALDSRDMVFVHVEAPDECAHAGDMAGKIRAIELFDARIVGPLAAGMAKTGGFRMLIMPDHPTLLSTRTHDAAPVPFIIYDSREPSGCGLCYGEANAAAGITVDPGCGLLGLLTGRY